MKKQRFFMLGIITVLVAVLSLTFVSSTFAKYTSTVSANDTAKVAKWEFQVDSKDIIGDDPQALVFDLFNQVNDLDANELVTDANDEEVKDGDVIVAPGTGGKFEFVIKNTSDVSAHLVVSFAELVDELPLEFSLTNEHGSWTDIAGINTALAGGKDLAYDDATGYTVTLYWRWAFNDNDTADTALGEAATATHQVEVTINATQIN